MKRLTVCLVACLLLTIFLPVGGISVAGDSDEIPNDEALAAAAKAQLPDGLTDAEADVFRLGYALGYYYALHPQDTTGEYVLNNNTMKFHYPSCQSAASISPDNRELYQGTKEELLAKGYKPCGVCKP